MVFLQKYQPTKLDDMFISDNIKQIVHGLIHMETLNMLLIGSNGTGKTTLIQCIINEYYENQNVKDDVLYINNLNEQGIHKFRQNIITFCQTNNTFLKKKTIVFDDIDNVNEQMQQIMRSCINKYSNNVNFISSCSNIQKVLDSIQSRVHILKLPSLSNLQLLHVLLLVKKKEHLIFSKECNTFLINISDNSVKYLLNNLEKLKILESNITLDLLQNVCTNICFDNLKLYTHYWYVEQNLSLAYKEFSSLYDLGYSVIDILENYFTFVKITNLLTDDIKFKILPYICKYITIFQTIHENNLELLLFTHDLMCNI